MDVLKQIKFGSITTPIAMTKVAIKDDSKNALSVIESNIGLEHDADPLYTIALAVDGKTITKTGNDGLATALALKVEAASGKNKARIALVDSNGGNGYAVRSSVNIEDIVGGGIVQGSAYEPSTGILTITWAGSTEENLKTTKIDLGALLDIQDIIIKSDSTNYLSFTPVDAGTDTGGQAQIGVKLADVTYTPTNGPTPANLTVNAASGKLLDAEHTITAVKGYVDDVLANASTNLAVKAEGDDYVAAKVDAGDNKKVIVKSNVKTLTATAGTPGVYGADGSVKTAPNAGTLSGTANSLGDAADIATKVKTYVDGAIAIEAARSNAKNLEEIDKLDVPAVGGADGDVLTQISETDGKISAVNSSLTDVKLTGYAADSKQKGAIVATDTLEQALNKIENTIASTTVKYNVVGTTLIVANVTKDTSLLLKKKLDNAMQSVLYLE